MKHRQVEEWVRCDRCGADERADPRLFEQRTELEWARYGPPANQKHRPGLVRSQQSPLDLCRGCTAVFIEMLENAIPSDRQGSA